MNEELMLRLNLLLGAGEIDQEILDSVEAFSILLEERYQLRLTEEKGSMLITHLAMSLARIKRGEAIEEMDPGVLSEIKENRVYQDLPLLYAAIEERLNIALPESEKGYIALHICSLLAQ